MIRRIATLLLLGLGFPLLNPAPAHAKGIARTGAHGAVKAGKVSVKVVKAVAKGAWKVAY